ncbi:MAG TPA: VWA domain-containing protein, partial [Terriglobia bacterium]|nr:VWA domain-containing protein [Terriglobia bacterium]
RIRTDVVNVFASVKDKKGHVISNLAAADFEITEDGFPQKIGYYSLTHDLPLSVGLLIDTGSWCWIQAIDAEKEAAEAFVKEAIDPSDSGFVMVYDRTEEMKQDMTDDPVLLLHGIQGAEAIPRSGNRTHCLFDAVVHAARYLLENGRGRRVLVLFTEGNEGGSSRTPERALRVAQDADVTIYTVMISSRVGSSIPLVRGGSAPAALSEGTGGEIINVHNAQAAAAAARQIKTELRLQYFLGYTPSNRSEDGSFRRIQVSVRRRNCKVQARKGYFAPIR